MLLGVSRQHLYSPVSTRGNNTESERTPSLQTSVRLCLVVVELFKQWRGAQSCFLVSVMEKDLSFSSLFLFLLLVCVTLSDQARNDAAEWSLHLWIAEVENIWALACNGIGLVGGLFVHTRYVTWVPRGDWKNRVMWCWCVCVQVCHDERWRWGRLWRAHWALLRRNQCSDGRTDCHLCCPSFGVITEVE